MCFVHHEWLFCGVLCCGVLCCGVVWCGVVWCGVLWCGVVYPVASWLLVVCLELDCALCVVCCVVR